MRKTRNWRFGIHLVKKGLVLGKISIKISYNVGFYSRQLSGIFYGSIYIFYSIQDGHQPHPDPSSKASKFWR